MLAKLIKPFHFKVFFSKKYVHASVLDKVTNVIVAAVKSNSWACTHHLGDRGNKNDERACAIVGKLLMHRVKERQVSIESLGRLSSF